MKNSCSFIISFDKNWFDNLKNVPGKNDFLIWKTWKRPRILLRINTRHPDSIVSLIYKINNSYNKITYLIFYIADVIMDFFPDYFRTNDFNRTWLLVGRSFRSRWRPKENKIKFNSTLFVISDSKKSLNTEFHANWIIFCYYWSVIVDLTFWICKTWCQIWILRSQNSQNTNFYEIENIIYGMYMCILHTQCLPSNSVPYWGEYRTEKQVGKSSRKIWSDL